jgi:hypothetical protein
MEEEYKDVPDAKPDHCRDGRNGDGLHYTTRADKARSFSRGFDEGERYRGDSSAPENEQQCI